MTDQELKDLVASLARDKERLLSEFDKTIALIHTLVAANAATRQDFTGFQADANCQLLEAHNQISHNEQNTWIEDRHRYLFDDDEEYPTFPVLADFLEKQFGVDVCNATRSVNSKNDSIPLVGLGIVENRSEGYLVKKEQKLDNDSVEKMKEYIAKFRVMMPIYANLTIFGIILFEEGRNETIKEVLQAGFGVASFRRNVIRWHSGKDFLMKPF